MRVEDGVFRAENCEVERSVGHLRDVLIVELDGDWIDRERTEGCVGLLPSRAVNIAESSVEFELVSSYAGMMRLGDKYQEDCLRSGQQITARACMHLSGQALRLLSQLLHADSAHPALELSERLRSTEVERWGWSWR